MNADIDPAFADRCAVTAINLRTLADLGESPDADPDPIARAAWLTGQLLADPEALLAVALVIEQQRAASADDPRLVETRRLRDKLRDIYAEFPPPADEAEQERRAQAVIAEIRAVWA